MKDVQQFIREVQSYGLEKFGIFYGSYRGTVVSNEDPENLGRLQIKCAAIYDDQTFDDWVIPKGVIAGNGTGILWLPQKDDPIYISCEAGNPRFPLWEYGWWLRNKTIEGATPKNKIFVTPYGHRVEMNDEQKFIDIKHASGFHVKLFEDGIYLGKGSDNLGKFLDDLFELFSTTTVATIYGPSPFNNVAAYNQLRTKIQMFLKTS